MKLEAKLELQLSSIPLQIDGKGCKLQVTHYLKDNDILTDFYSRFC